MDGKIIFKCTKNHLAIIRVLKGSECPHLSSPWYADASLKGTKVVLFSVKNLKNLTQSGAYIIINYNNNLKVSKIYRIYLFIIFLSTFELQTTFNTFKQKTTTFPLTVIIIVVVQKSF